MIPNLTYVVEQTKADYPEAWKAAHMGGPHTEDFIKICAARMHAIDPRFGLNGKRGNPADLSDDAVNVIGEGPGRTPQGVPCQVIDVIGSAGSANAYPTWQPFSNPQDASGAWVQPGDAPAPEPEPEPEPPHVCPPVPPTFPYPDENTHGKNFQQRVKQAYTDAGRKFPDPNDQDAFRHFQRYGFSAHEMPESEAADKHIAELRAQLGV